MAKKTPMGKLQDAIAASLEKYDEDVKRNVFDSVKSVAKTGASALRSESRQKFGGTGKYASGWSFKFSQQRLKASAVIYNKNEPRLAHLLEFGHAKRNGGRVEGRPHIAPVEEEIIDKFQKEIVAKL